MKSKETKMSWTDDRIGLLKKMWKDGKSAAEIAKALGKGVTRNAVIGKAHRLGLSGRPVVSSPAAKKEKAAAKPAKPAPAAKKPVAPPLKDIKPKKPAPPKVEEKPAAPAVKAKKAVAKKLLPLREPEPVPVFDKEEIPPGGGTALIDLTERMCKWPIGDPREADFTFCGLAIRPGTPYCPGHAATAYQSSSRRGAAVAVAVEKEEVADDEEEAIETDDEIDEEEDVEAVE